MAPYKRKRVPKVVVVLDATPYDTPALRTSEEIRIITDACDRSRRRNDFSVVVKTSVTGTHLRRAILDLKPEILHICAHGSRGKGIVFENEKTNCAHVISAPALVGALRLATPPLSCVVFNVCNSEKHANQAVQYVPYAIGMRSMIRDNEALTFSQGFYDGVFAGETYTISFEWGVNAMQTAGMPGYITPRLKTREPLLQASQTVVSRYYYEDRVEKPTMLGDTGFSVQRMHAQVWQILDLRTSETIFVEQTIINLRSMRDNFAMPYTSEWVFEEVKGEVNRKGAYPITTAANMKLTRRIGLDGFTLDTADKDLNRRFDECKQQLLGMFPRGLAKWRENENGELEKIIDYHNGEPPELFIYQRFEK